jgi:hypothetical protein
MIAIVAAIAACKKSGPESGSGTAAGSGSAAATSSAGATTGSSSESGSSAAAASAGAGATAGSSAGAGSADSNAGAGSSAGSNNAASGYDKAAFLEDPLCEQVADKIRACVDKPEFIAALDDGADAQQKKVNARLRKGVKKWQKAHELCTNAWDIINYEYTGFLDKPVVFKAPAP